MLIFMVQYNEVGWVGGVKCEMVLLLPGYGAMLKLHTLLILIVLHIRSASLVSV